MATGNNVNHISVLPVSVVTENLVRQEYAKFFYQTLRSSADRPALGEFNADTSSALVIVNRPRSAQQQLIYNPALCSVTAASAQIERSQTGSLFVSGSVTQLCGITRDFTFRSSSSAPYLKQNHHSTVTSVVTNSTIRSQFLPLAQTKSAAVIIEQQSTTTNIGLSRISTTKMASDRLIGFDSPQTVYDDKNAIQFNGSNQYLTTPTAPFAFGSANFTVEAFVYLNAMPTSDAWPTAYASHMVLATVGTASVGDGIGFIIGMTKLIVQNNNTQYASTPHGMAPNTLYHIAFVRNGNNVYFYVNGEAKGSVAFNVSAGTGASGWIGSETGQGAFFNGKISNLRIVHNTAVYTAAFAMPQGQLTNIANTALLACRSPLNFTPSTEPLTAIANTSLLTCQSSTFIDNSPNSLTLTNFGNVSVQAFSPFGSVSYSVYFDGTGDYLQVANDVSNQMGSGDWTAEAWIYITSYSNLHVVFSKSGSTTDWFLAIKDSSGRLYFGVGTSDYFATTGPIVPLNTWNHVALVRSGTTINSYLNGVLGNTQTGISQTFASTGVLRIGRGRDTSANYLSGYVSNARLVKGTAVYITGVADLSNNAYTITAVNSPTNTTLGAYLPGAFSVTPVAILGPNGYGVGTVSVPVSLNENRIEIIGAGPLQVGSYKMTQRYTTVITQSNNATRATSDHVANEFTEPVFVYVLTPPSVRAAYQFGASPDKNGIAATVNTQTVTVSSAYTRSSLPPNAFSITYGNRALTRHNVSITQVNCSVLDVKKRSPDVIEKLVVVNDLASIKAKLIFVNTGANAGASRAATAAPYGTAAVFVPGDGQLAVGSNSEFWY